MSQTMTEPRYRLKTCNLRRTKPRNNRWTLLQAACWEDVAFEGRQLSGVFDARPCCQQPLSLTNIAELAPSFFIFHLTHSLLLS